MFGFGRKKDPKIYLGSIGVIPKPDSARADEKGLLRSEDFEAVLHCLLKEIFCLSPLRERSVEMDDDLVLDVFVANYQGGVFEAITSTEFFVPIFWRPEIELRARLTSVKTGQVIAVHVSRSKMRWRHYWSSVLTVKRLIGLTPVFTVKDMEPLFIEAAYGLLLKLKKAVKKYT